MNTLQRIYEKYHELPFNYRYLSGNISIGRKFVKTMKRCKGVKKWRYNNFPFSIDDERTYFLLNEDHELNTDDVGKILKKIPNLDFGKISASHNIYGLSVDFVKKYIDRNWDWDCLSDYMHVEDILKIPEGNWDYDRVDTGVNDSNIGRIKRFRKFDVRDVCRIPGISKEYITKNYNITELSEEYTSTTEDSGYDIESDIDILVAALCYKFSLDEIIGFIGDKINRYSWETISQNCNLTMKDIDNNINRIDFDLLAHNDCFTKEMMEKYFYRFDTYTITSQNGINRHIFEMIKKFPDREYNWRVLSYSPPPYSVLKYSKKWEWKYVSMYVDIEVIEYDLENNLEPFPWDWESIASNKSLSFEFFEKYVEKLKPYMKELSQNSCCIADQKEIGKILERIFGKDLSCIIRGMIRCD